MALVNSPWSPCPQAATSRPPCTWPSSTRAPWPSSEVRLVPVFSHLVTLPPNTHTEPLQPVLPTAPEHRPPPGARLVSVHVHSMLCSLLSPHQDLPQSLLPSLCFLPPPAPVVSKVLSAHLTSFLHPALSCQLLLFFLFIHPRLGCSCSQRGITLVFHSEGAQYLSLIHISEPTRLS